MKSFLRASRLSYRVAVFVDAVLVVQAAKLDIRRVVRMIRIRSAVCRIWRVYGGENSKNFNSCYNGWERLFRGSVESNATQIYFWGKWESFLMERFMIDPAYRMPLMQK